MNERSVPFASVSFKVIKLPTFEFVSAESSKFRTASVKVNVISELVAIDAVITASMLTDGGMVSPAENTAKVVAIALSYESSTVEPIETYTVCSLLRSSVKSIEINCLWISIVASNAMSAPLELVSLTVIKLSTLTLFIAELSSNRISSSK